MNLDDLPHIKALFSDEQFEGAKKRAEEIANSASTGTAFNKQQLQMDQLQIEATSWLIATNVVEIERLIGTLKELDKQNKKLENAGLFLGSTAIWGISFSFIVQYLKFPAFWNFIVSTAVMLIVYLIVSFLINKQ